MVDAETHPPGIGCHVIDAIRRDLAELLVDEVVHSDEVRTTRRTIIAAAVFEVADQFLFLRINRYHWLSCRLKSQNLAVNMLELAIAVRMTAALFGLAIGVTRIAKSDQHLAD